MLIFIDERAPEKAKRQLSVFGDVIPFATKGICYDAVSGHPDIFIFQHREGLILAPNTPEKYKTILRSNGVGFVEGNKPVGSNYPYTAHYNALFTERGVLHNKNICELTIVEACYGIVHCRQGYVRCNTIKIGDVYYTSDRGIEKVLQKGLFKTCYVDSQKIILQGFDHGFFGGCCGVSEQSVFICGEVLSLKDGEMLKQKITGSGFQIVELCKGPMIDVGGIFFIKTA
jgi:hypothetical protein